MIPELGKYAVEVLSAYAVSIGLLAALLGITLHRGRMARSQLKQAEAEVKTDGAV